VSRITAPKARRSAVKLRLVVLVALVFLTHFVSGQTL